MSVADKEGLKVVLPRLGVDHLWEDMREHYAARNKTKWRHFAMLTLAELGNWPIEQIAIAMDHAPGHVSRCIHKIKSELREKFDDPFFEQPPRLPDRDEERATRSAFDTPRTK